jgi:lipopolysaccharide-binding protein
VQVAQFAKPSAKVASNPATGLTLTFSNAVVLVRGNWRIKYGLIKKSGWLECTVNAAMMSVSAILGTSSTGQPTIRSTGCNCVISSVTIKLHGGGSKIIDRHIHQIEGMLKNDLQTKLCREAQQAISVTASRRLAKINMRVRFIYSVVC